MMHLRCSLVTSLNIFLKLSCELCAVTLHLDFILLAAELYATNVWLCLATAVIKFVCISSFAVALHPFLKRTILNRLYFKTLPVYEVYTNICTRNL